MDISRSLQEIKQNLKKWGCNVEDTDNGITWALPTGQSSIFIEPINTPSIEGGTILGVVHYIHQLDQRYSEVMNDQNSAVWNRHSSLSALIPGIDNEPPVIVSKVTLYKGDEEMWSLRYAPMLCTEAYNQPNAILNELHEWHLEPGAFGLTDHGNPSPYSAQDFDSVNEWCRSIGFYSNSSDEGLSAEFSWDKGAMSAGFSCFAECTEDNEEKDQYLELSSRTILLRLLNNTQHPCLGNGMLSTLQLPINIKSAENLSRIVSDLNRWERDSIDMPPLFGCWCVDTLFSSPTFVMFLPNELCMPGMPRTITAWMANRYWRTRHFLQQNKNIQ